MPSLSERKSARESRLRPWLTGSVLSSARKLASKVAAVPSDKEVKDHKPRPLNLNHRKSFALKPCLKIAKPRFFTASCSVPGVEHSQGEHRTDGVGVSSTVIRRREATRRFFSRIPKLARIGAQKIFDRKKGKLSFVHFRSPVTSLVRRVPLEEERSAPGCDMGHKECDGYTCDLTIEDVDPPGDLKVHFVDWIIHQLTLGHFYWWPSLSNASHTTVLRVLVLLCASALRSWGDTSPLLRWTLESEGYEF